MRSADETGNLRVGCQSAYKLVRERNCFEQRYFLQGGQKVEPLILEQSGDWRLDNEMVRVTSSFSEAL